MLSVQVYTFWHALSLKIQLDSTFIVNYSFIFNSLVFFVLIYKAIICPFSQSIAIKVHLGMTCSDNQILFQVCFSQAISLYRSITCILRSQAWPAHFQDFLQTNNSSSEHSSVSSLKTLLSKAAQTMDFKMFLLPQPRWFFWYIKELYRFY